MTPVESNGEGKLLERARARDFQAFAELVRRYERRIFRLARNITQNDADAEDVLQESFLKAFTHLDTFEGNSRFYTWLVRIGVNEALMKLRKRRDGKFVSLDEPVEAGDDEMVREIAVWDGDPESKFSAKQLRSILDQAINELAPIYRVVFQLRDVEEMSTEETAEALGLTVPAVKSRLQRARLQLREKLTRQFKRKEDDLFAYL